MDEGDALAKALEAQDWDPSVKSLVNFPQVLTMMSEKLDWTQKLGDAFLEDQKTVLDTIQSLRAKAQANNKLATTKQQKVSVQKQDNRAVIVIQQVKFAVEGFRKIDDPANRIEPWNDPRQHQQ